MLSILVCLIQLSVVAIIAIAAARQLMPRAPELAARICTMAIVLSSVVVLLCLCGTPRLWNLANATASSPGGNPIFGTNQGAGEPSPLSEFNEPLRFRFEFALNQAIERVAELQIQHSAVDTRLKLGFYTLASLLGLFCVARSVGGVWWLRRLSEARALSDSSPPVNELKALQRQAGSDRSMRICESSQVASPCISWFRPGTIYVPAGFEHWSAEERRATLAHELSHELRRDPQRRLVADACLAFVYFHPLMLILRKQLVFAQELATDRHAAHLLGSLSLYRRGLSLLALRMDSQCNQFSLVSVSNNDVIRRIKMLKSNQPKLRRWQEIVSISAVAGALVLSAAWTATADDTIRIASIKKDAAKSARSVTLAELPPPWESLGPQPGYFQASPRLMDQNPALKLLYESYTKEMVVDVGLDTLGLNATNIERLQAPVVITLTQIPEEDRSPSGEKHTMSIGTDAVVVDTIEPVSWTQAVEKIPETLLQADAVTAVKEKLAKFDGTRHMSFLSKAAQARSEEHMPQLRAVWKQVGDCTVAIALSKLDALTVDLTEESDLVGAKGLAKLVDTFAMGIHVVDEESTQTFRMSFAPKQSATPEEVVEQLTSMRDSIVQLGQATMSAAAPESDADSDTPNQSEMAMFKQLLTELAAMEFDVEQTSEDIKVITAELTTAMDFAAALENRRQP